LVINEDEQSDQDKGGASKKKEEPSFSGGLYQQLKVSKFI